MSFTNQTTHYGLPQWIGSDKPTYLVDQNNAYQTIDAEIYNANTTAGAAQTAAEGAVATAGAASTTAADALTAAQTASTTADNALTEAQTANTNAQAAQTAAGAAQTAAQAAQEAAAGNSITNLAPAYDPTITYAVDDLVTAEGKLYKCIVAVTTPEQFDINKWDDVTTSEVYARTSIINKLSTFNMDDSSSFTYRDDNNQDYAALFANKGNKARIITYDCKDNLVIVSKSNDGGENVEDSYLYPTLVKGQTFDIKIDSVALVVSNDSVWIMIHSPSFIDSSTTNFAIILNSISLGHKAGTSGNYQPTATTASLISMRKDCAVISVTSNDIASENYDVNSIIYAYADITITRNN